MAGPIVVGEFRANSREVARVTLENYRGHDLIRIHKWFAGDDGEPHPCKGGIAVNVKHMPILSELIFEALVQARHLGLIRNGESDASGGAR
jgi:Transcriptional Coactivator p15 (PC4)